MTDTNCINAMALKDQLMLSIAYSISDFLYDRARKKILFYHQNFTDYYFIFTFKL